MRPTLYLVAHGSKQLVSKLGDFTLFRGLVNQLAGVHYSYNQTYI